MKAKLLGAGAFIVILVAVLVGTGNLNTADTGDCRLQVVESPTGETFSSVSELRETWEKSSDKSWEETTEGYNFVIQDGKVHIELCQVNDPTSGGSILGGLI